MKLHIPFQSSPFREKPKIYSVKEVEDLKDLFEFLENQWKKRLSMFEQEMGKSTPETKYHIQRSAGFSIWYRIPHIKKPQFIRVINCGTLKNGHAWNATLQLLVRSLKTINVHAFFETRRDKFHAYDR